jgi:Zn-finger nucleic acid-binding protein
LQDGELENVIERLLATRPEDYEVLHAASRFNDLERRFEKNLLLQAEYEVAKAKILATLTEICKNL